MRVRHQRRQLQRFCALVERLEERRLLASIVVNNLSDATGLPNGQIDLREAINTANTATTPTTITFDPSLFSTNKTFLLSGGVLELKNTKQPTTITGPAGGVTVKGNKTEEVFEVDKSVHLSLTDFTITGGVGVVHNGSEAGIGGGIYNDGTMTLTNVTVSGNTAGFGGGIYNGGTMTLTNVTVSGNTAGDFGGGINNNDTMTLTNVTVSGNTAVSGGGIGNHAGTMTLTNVTVSGNTAVSGGGIGNVGTMTLTNVTVSGNTAGTGGGISNFDPIMLTNSIIAGNSGSSGVDAVPEVVGSFTSFGNNLIGKTDGSQGWNASDLTGTAAHPLDAKLGLLANNGGPTQTMLPTLTSPAVNGGNNALIPKGIITDQRGLPRISGGMVDIGAVEVQTASLTVTPPPTKVTVKGKTFPLIIAATAGVSTKLPLGSFTETNATGPYTVDVNWGDGLADTKFTVTAAGTIPATAHTYFTTNTTEITDQIQVTVTDAKGAKSNTDSFSVKIDPGSLNTITGTVFNDKNSNTKQDSGEAGVANATVYFDVNSNSTDDSGEPSAMTNSSGIYTLTIPGAETVLIRQVVPASSNQTTPANKAGISVTLTGTSQITGKNFGVHDNSQINTGFLFKGLIFDDINKDGRQEKGELGLGGWEVYADINHDNKLDTGDATAFTNNNGAYTLGLTGGGTFLLHEIVPANWTQTHPTNNTGISITVNSTSTKTGLNFGDTTTIKYLRTVATTSGIVAWWTFDSSSQANSILNGYTGTLQGSAKISAAGKGAPITGEQNNTALVLNGTSSKVTTNLTTQQEFTTAATYNVWINLGSTPAKSGHVYEILAKSQFQNDLDLQVETDGSVHFYTDTGSSTSFKPSSLTGWHMVTAEFDTVAKTRTIFWDGKQVAQANPYNGTHDPSTQAFTIGNSGVFAGRFFDGSIDEVSLWNRALTATEVTAIFNASKSA